MTRPKRLQLSRAKGWKLPAGARSVAYPTPYANPYRPSERGPEANAAAVASYRAWILAQPQLIDQARQELAGRDLACWCPPSLPCHADVLIEFVN